MSRTALVLFFVLLCMLNPFNNSCHAASSKAVPAISITSGLVIGGATLLFVIRANRRTDSSADSIIAIAHTLWRRTNTAYASGAYREAGNAADSIKLMWNRYFDALVRKQKKDFIGKDSLLSIIHFSDVYQKHAMSLMTLQQIAARLPADQENLLSWNRHDLNQLIENIRETIDDTISRYKNDKETITMVYSPIFAAITSVDSLFLTVYNGERLNFSLKNRFFYNRVIEENSRIALEQFVDDCDYYNVDKEWCERARLSLNPLVNGESKSLSSGSKSAAVKKLTSIDTMNLLFEQAVSSRSIEQLESYLKKYSNKKFRNVARLDRVRTLLDTVRKELLTEQLFSRQHPRISDIHPDKIVVSITGLPLDIKNSVSTIIDTLKREFGAMTSLRAPATLSLDYSSVPPLFLLSGYVHTTKDIIYNDSLNERRFIIQGAAQGFELLDKIARQCCAVIPPGGNPFTYAPAYAIRFIKNGETYLTMYGSGRKMSGIELYHFFDVSVPGFQNVRIQYTPEQYTISLPAIRDTANIRLGRQFFEK